MCRMVGWGRRTDGYRQVVAVQDSLDGGEMLWTHARVDLAVVMLADGDLRGELDLEDWLR